MIVLAYHLVSDNVKNAISISWEKFHEQITWLIKNNYIFTNLDECSLQNKQKSSNLIALTFDDGYRNTITEVMPYLKRNGIIASMALNAGFLTRRISLNKAPHEIKNLADVDEVKLWIDSGMKICGHTYSHVKLTDISDKKKEWQIAYDKYVLESIYNVKIKNFVYPYGSWDEKCVEIVKKYYEAAYATSSGSNMNSWNISRLEILPDWSIKDFIAAIERYKYLGS